MNALHSISMESLSFLFNPKNPIAHVDIGGRNHLSVIDVIRECCQVNIIMAMRIFNVILHNNKELMKDKVIIYHKFSDAHFFMPVVNCRTLVFILLLLPGEAGSQFRWNVAKWTSMFLSGNLAMIEDVITIHNGHVKKALKNRIQDVNHEDENPKNKRPCLKSLNLVGAGLHDPCNFKTISEYLGGPTTSLNQDYRSRIGQMSAKFFYERYYRANVVKKEEDCNGAMFFVNAYKEQDFDLIDRAIRADYEYDVKYGAFEKEEMDTDEITEKSGKLSVS